MLEPPSDSFLYSLLFNLGSLASGIRRWNTAELFLKLHPNGGDSTPTAAGLEQAHISSPGFSLALIVLRANQTGVPHKKILPWPLAVSAEACLYSLPK